MIFQHELIPLVQADLGEVLTKPLQQLVRIWELIGIERFIPPSRGWVGRPARERVAVARAFVAKTVLNIPTTVALVERLTVDACLRRLCGFDMRKKLPGEHLFSGAFAEFTEQGLMQQAHADLIHRHLHATRGLWSAFKYAGSKLTEELKSQFWKEYVEDVRSNAILPERRARSSPRVVRQPVRKWARKMNQKSYTGDVKIAVIPL